MKVKFWDWILFTGLCLIWGSSFILMKKGMYSAAEKPTLSAYHVAAIRMLSGGMILLPVAVKHIFKVSAKTLGLLLISGLCGSFFPAFLFCIAETRINSALAGTLNATTPLFVIIMGALFFNHKASTQKVIGVVTGLVGSILLFLTHGYDDLGYIGYAFFVLMATILYGINVNTVQHYLKNVAPLQIAAVSFALLIPLALLVLHFTDYFKLPLYSHDYLLSTLYASILGIMGTALASYIFYVLVQRTSGLFSSLVTYGIPFVAIGWGLLDGEMITLVQVFCLLIILSGVYITNRQKL
jgi:drug/metabolite transporter (DMT)-like permease